MSSTGCELCTGSGITVHPVIWILAGVCILLCGCVPFTRSIVMKDKAAAKLQHHAKRVISLFAHNTSERAETAGLLHHLHNMSNSDSDELTALKQEVESVAHNLQNAEDSINGEDLVTMMRGLTPTQSLQVVLAIKNSRKEDVKRLNQEQVRTELGEARTKQAQQDAREKSVTAVSMIHTAQMNSSLNSQLGASHDDEMSSGEDDHVAGEDEFDVVNVAGEEGGEEGMMNPLAAYDDDDEEDDYVDMGPAMAKLMKQNKLLGKSSSSGNRLGVLLEDVTALVKLLVSQFQIVSGFETAISIDWPTQFMMFVSVTSFVSVDIRDFVSFGKLPIASGLLSSFRPLTCLDIC